MQSETDSEEPPKVSSARVAYHQKKLRKLLGRADIKGFLQMMWAVDALHSGRVEPAMRVLPFPRDAVDQSPGSQYAVHQWELETLATLFFTTSTVEPQEQSAIDTGKYQTVADLINGLRKLEDMEAALYLGTNHVDIFTEMHRIAQRQFHWQHGYLNLPQFYRSTFIYAQGICADYFQERFGFPITEISFIGMALYQYTSLNPWVPRSIGAPEIGLTKELVSRALPLLLSSARSMRDESLTLVNFMNQKHGRDLPTAFLPSRLRRFPLLCLEGGSSNIIAPIADMLLLRVTSGLYFDIVDGGQTVVNEANDRFELYCANIIDAMMPRLKVSRSKKYVLKKGLAVDSPDILVTDENRVAMIVECKASKLTYLAQFSENPFETASAQYEQIANGVFQLWRFFSHVRQGFFDVRVDGETIALILTLEAFGLMHQELKGRILARASELADKDLGISAEDRRPIIFCSIDRLEGVLSKTTEDGFLGVLKAAHDAKYIGWELSEICKRELREQENINPKKFPFDLRDLLPWWTRIDEYGKAKRNANSDHLSKKPQ